MASIDLSKYSEKEKVKTPAKKQESSGRVSDILNTEISFFEKKFGAKEKEGFYS